MRQCNWRKEARLTRLCQTTCQTVQGPASSSWKKQPFTALTDTSGSATELKGHQDSETRSKGSHCLSKMIFASFCGCYGSNLMNNISLDLEKFPRPQTLWGYPNCKSEAPHLRCCWIAFWRYPAIVPRQFEELSVTFQGMQHDLKVRGRPWHNIWRCVLL